MEQGLNEEEQQNVSQQEDEENFLLEDQDQGVNALNLKFSIGFSSDKVGAVHNLTLDEKKVKKIR
jgi:hypothetical protein